MRYRTRIDYDRQPSAPHPDVATYWLLSLGLLVGLVALACNMPYGTPTPTPTPLPPALCNQNFVELPRPAQPADVNAYQAVIADFLTAGGAPSSVEAMLRAWGVIDDQYGLVDATHDFDSDRLLDVVVTLHYPPTSTTLQPPGQLLAFGCTVHNEGERAYTYQVRYGLASAPGSTTSMPNIIFLGDITADGQPEIVFYQEHCTTYACFREPYIMTWSAERDGFRSLHSQFDRFYRFRDENGQIVRGFPWAGFELRDLTGDGPLEFIVDENEVTARQVGPHRPAVYTWTWHGIEYSEPVVVYDDSNYRIHWLWEADRYLEAGDLDAALALYNQTINNRDLIAWGGPTPKQDTQAVETAILDAYNWYRLMLVHAALRDNQATTYRDLLAGLTPSPVSSAIDAYASLAGVFIDRFYSTTASSDPLGAACQAVQQRADDTPALQQSYLFFNDQEYFGTALGTYTIQDLCPFYSPAANQ
ncbi:MAG: hypothetical protein JW910_18920 [Anaerolineae bacterium]|nr:hypothetical protein [Anaerolineae bacterium]